MHMRNRTVLKVNICWGVLSRTAGFLTMLAYNLFKALINLNLKPALRKARAIEHFSRIIVSEIYGRSAGRSP